MDPSQYRINNFIIEFKRIYNLNPNNIQYSSWEVKYGSRWIILIGIITNKSHMLFKIDSETCDIYAPRDIKPRGNINNEFNGFNLFDNRGIIYNIHEKRKQYRINELLSIKKRRTEEFKIEEMNWKFKSLDYTVLNKEDEDKKTKSSESCEF